MLFDRLQFSFMIDILEVPGGVGNSENANMASDFDLYLNSSSTLCYPLQEFCHRL